MGGLNLRKKRGRGGGRDEERKEGERQKERKEAGEEGREGGRKGNGQWIEESDICCPDFQTLHYNHLGSFRKTLLSAVHPLRSVGVGGSLSIRNFKS